MTARLKRLFVAVFLVVFLGGLGVSGAVALWSQQGSVQATVSTGTWGKEPSPTIPPTEPWDWGLTLGDGGKVKGEGVVILSWTPPSEGDVVVKADGATAVNVLSTSRAEVTLGRGPGCYPLRISAVSADGTTQLLSGAVTFHPGGGRHGTFTFTEEAPLCG